MSGARTVAAYALRESLRRRVFAVVLLLTVGFLGLYALGAFKAFDETDAFRGPGQEVDTKTLTGATLLGLGMFATLFLGAVLAVFLTLGAVRGDAERGLLQPLVVRPLGRGELLAGRFAAAATVCAAYVLAVYAAAMAITAAAGGWWPDRIVLPALGLAAAVVLIAALSLLGSVFLAATANGIAIFMVFGAGLTAGLLGQIGEAIASDTLRTVGRTASWALPFEALYQSALHGLTVDTGGTTGFVLSLGPFGGAQEAGALLGPWTLLYLAGVGALALYAFRRQDL